MTEGDSSPGTGEDPHWTAEEFAALAAEVVANAGHRFIASTAPGAMAALATFASSYPELDDVVEAIEHEPSKQALSAGEELGFGPAAWPAQGVAVVRISARWPELQQWVRRHGWRVVRIPGAVRQVAATDPGAPSGSVYWMERLPGESPDPQTW